MSEPLLRRYWQSQDPYDPDGLAACRHPRWFAEWPQSGERIVSNEDDVRIHSAYPGYPRHEQGRSAVGESETWVLSPSFVPIRVTGAGAAVIAEGRLDYPDLGRYHVAILIELEDDLIARETAYFAEDFDPPEWRADLAESIPEEPPRGHGELAIRIDPTTGSESADADALRRFFAAPFAGESPEEARRLYQAGMREIYAPDAEQLLVQSGERFRGLDRMMALVDRHPDFPTAGTLRRVTPVGNACVLEARLQYAQGAFWEVMIVEFRRGRAIRSTEYYAAEFDPPAWRSQWVERM